jgi:pilus assembly protein CpaE
LLKVSVIGSHCEDIVAGFRDRHIRVSSAGWEELDRVHPAGSAGPDAFVADIRDIGRLPRAIAQVRRLFPASGLVIVARTVDSADLLEAMRVGVNEWVAEPLNLAELAAAVHRVARPVARAQIGRTIAVIGAKGGIGSTTVAVNLATSLHRTSKESTLLIDLHLAHGDAAVFLGVEPRFSVVDALENVHRLDEAYLKGLVTATKAGVDLLPSSSNLLRGAFDTARVRSLLEFAATCYRYVVLDCPRSDATMLEAIDAASQIVVLANQELTTLRTASRLLTGLRQRCGNERVKLAITRLDAKSEIGQTDVEKVLGGPVKYVFPNDYQASLIAITRGEPLILRNHSRLASSFEHVARDLGGLAAKENKKDVASGGGLFARFGTRR